MGAWYRWLLILLVAGVVAGCGYRPLYGTGTDDRGVVAALSSVEIPVADSRLGQQIRNDLLSSMNFSSTGGPSRYSLKIEPKLSESNVIDRTLPNAGRRAVQLVAAYELVDQQSGNVVNSGKTFSQVSYDVVRQPFADAQAQENATVRAVHEVSGDIRTRLAAYFAGGH